ncbi:hypothetical protein HKX48_000826 [Thoreauomyces humboldtii]|nr:hypothetical protein HKX48_000826 [Thoreauomyces humboldtii]
MLGRAGSPPPSIVTSGRTGWITPPHPQLLQPCSPRRSATNTTSTSPTTPPASPLAAAAAARYSRAAPTISFPHHPQHSTNTSNADHHSHASIPFSQGTSFSRSSCDACKLRAERIAEAKARVETAKTGKRITPWHPVGSATPLASPLPVTSPVRASRQSLTDSLSAVSPKVDSGLRSHEGTPRSVTSPWKRPGGQPVSPAGSSPSGTGTGASRDRAQSTRPVWISRPSPAADYRSTPRPRSATKPRTGRTPAAPISPQARRHVTASIAAAAEVANVVREPSVPIPSTAVTSAVFKTLTLEPELTVEEDPISCPVVLENVLPSVAAGVTERPVQTGDMRSGGPTEPASATFLLPSVVATFTSADALFGSPLVVAASDSLTPLSCILPLAAVVLSDVSLVTQSSSVLAISQAIETLHLKPSPPVKLAVPFRPRAPSITIPTVEPPPIAQPLVLPPRRPRVDMTNLTAVSTHLQSTADSMQTLHRTLRSPTATRQEKSSTKASYIQDAEHLVALARDVCVSYTGPAKRCEDHTLRIELEGHLQQVSVLAVQLNAVARRKKADMADRDADGVVLACAGNLLSACLKAVDALNAVGITLAQ